MPGASPPGPTLLEGVPGTIGQPGDDAFYRLRATDSGGATLAQVADPGSGLVSLLTLGATLPRPFALVGRSVGAVLTVAALAGSAASLPASFEGVLLANELLDAMPVHQVTMTAEGLKEVYVTSDGIVERPPSTPRRCSW